MQRITTLNYIIFLNDNDSASYNREESHSKLFIYSV